MNPIAIYQSPSGAVDARLEGKAVWLALVCANFAHTDLERESTAQSLHIPSTDKPFRFDNRDVIISVGHRDKPYAGLQA